MSKVSDSSDSFQAFLDNQQYTEDGIHRYEFIFGKAYVSPGGESTTKEFVNMLDLNENSKVLDVGCGIGGPAFYIARTCGSRVLGVDLSSNMISIATKYKVEMDERIQKLVNFEMSDITKQDYEPNSFDVIFSRDVILHIEDKETLFSKLLDWLKPGGKLLITDYCRGDKEKHSQEFVTYVQQREYHLLTVAEYGRMLTKSGFENVVADDRTNQFIDILRSESSGLEDGKEEFLKQFTESNFKYMVDAWKVKTERCTSGDQAWGLFMASKPS